MCIIGQFYNERDNMRVFNGMRPEKNYTVVDNYVIRSKSLSVGAKILYVTIASIRTGKVISQEYLAKTLEVSKRTISRQISELKKEGLLLIKKTGLKNYECYLGTYAIKADDVFKWYNKELEDKGE